jgi:hypothetical protein
VSQAEESHSAVADRGLSPLLLFTAKTVIVTSIVTTAIILASSLILRQAEQVGNRLAEVVERSTKVGGSQFWSKVEAELDKAADPSRTLSPEKQKQLLDKLRRITGQWKPFAAEAYAIISEPVPVRADGKPN